MKRITMMATCPAARIIAADWGKASVEVGASTRVVVRSFKGRALLRLKMRASGRPGPEVVSGKYREGLGVDFVGSNQFNARMRLTSSSPQANRLEEGFSGADSLGRVYDQPPFPHFGPTLDELEPEITLAIAANVERLLR